MNINTKKKQSYISTISFFLIAGLITLIASCAKESTPPDKFYYGKVEIKLVDFPGTSPLEVYFGKEKLGTLTPGLSQTLSVSAGKAEHLNLKLPGSSTSLMDTLINVSRDGKVILSPAYSETTGISGFLQVGKPIGADSIEVQLLNALSKTYPAEKIDIKVMTYDANFNVVPVGIEFLGVSRNRLVSQSFKLPIMDANGAAIFYMVDLYDSVTKEPIIDVYGVKDYFIDWIPGSSYIVKIVDDPANGNIQAAYLPF